MTDESQGSFFDPQRGSDSPDGSDGQALARGVVAALKEHADAEQAVAMSAYMRERFEFFGISAAPRRAAVKHILSGMHLNWDFVHALWAYPQRECHYVAVDHLRRQKLTIADLEDLQQLVESHSWWDTVDHLAKCAGTALIPGSRGRGAEPNSLADAAAARALMLEWAVSENMWTRRTAILCQLSFGEKTDTELLREVLESNLGAEARFSSEFFITKAIGWALRDYSRDNPQWVHDFVNAHAPESDLALAKLSRKEALKHL